MERVLIEGRVANVEYKSGTSAAGKPYAFWETTIERVEPVVKQVSSDKQPDVQPGQSVVLPCEVYAGTGGRMRYRLLDSEPIRPSGAAVKAGS
jgi:hypothetical protein